MLGANGIVGGGLGIATGAALGAAAAGHGRRRRLLLRRRRAQPGHLPRDANFAAIQRLPVIFLCENNQFAMSMPVRPRDRPGAASRIGRPAYGFPGVTVDGMDVLAVREAVGAGPSSAPAPARGPTLIVADCYRFDGHHVGDPRSTGRRKRVAVARARPDRAFRAA